MKKISLLIIATLLLGVSSAYALKPRVVLGPGTGAGSFRLPYHQTWNRVLSKDTVYILTGWYFVDSTYSLTIPAGTLIYGDQPSAGSLIVKRGAQIFAAGTAAEPIVFTSQQPAGSRAPGDWGGVIVLGKAPVNQFEPQIEGGFATVAGASAPYGGNDPTDNSGVLTYVRIEWAGIAFAQDNEINGLTLGGVGSGTTIHHVQVSYANDDDVEFFGGTVEAKYILTMANIDDNFDTDFGFSGKLQFIAAFRDPLIFDASASGQSNGNESDNNGTAPYLGTPQTSYIASNMTLVGPFQDTSTVVNSKWGHLALYRRNTAPRTYNSIYEGWPLGINIRDSLTQFNAASNALRIRYCSVASKAPGVRATGNSPATGNHPGFDPIAWFNTPGWGNVGASGRQPSAIGLINPAQSQMALGTWDPRPAPGSEAATQGTDYSELDSFFDVVSYRGAFDPSRPLSQQWTAGWTQLDPQSYDPEASTTVTASLNNGWNLVSVPVSPANSSASVLFPTAVSGTINSYLTGTYTQPSTLNVGEGYWAFYSAATSNPITGGPVNTASVTVTGGNRWVLVGSVSASKPAANLVSSPSGAIVGGTLNSWNGTSYAAPTTLDPGKGYWVFVSQPCTLTINP
jgi:hypothetical protein